MESTTDAVQQKMEIGRKEAALNVFTGDFYGRGQVEGPGSRLCTNALTVDRLSRAF